MSNRDDKIKELTNRLNHLRLQRREIARKEQGVYHQLRIVVFGPAPPRNTAAAVQAPLPDEVRSGDSEGSENELSNSDTEASPPPLVETPIETEADLDLLPIGPREHLRKGQPIYIVNSISHYREIGTRSIEHRLGKFVKETFGGRVHIKTRSGHSTWRQRKNLNKATINYERN